MWVRNPLHPALGWHAALLSASAGPLFAFAFPPWNITWLAWFALAPIALGAAFDSGRRALFFVSVFVAGFLAHGQVLDFIRTTEGELGGARTWWWLALSGLCAVGWCVAAWGLQQVYQHLKWPMAISLPVVWVTHDFLRFLAFGAVFSIGLPWAQLGHTQSESPIGQVAEFSGVFGVTAILAMGSGAVVDLLLCGRSRRMWRAPLVAAAIVITLAASFGWYRAATLSTSHGPSVTLMPDAYLPKSIAVGPGIGRADIFLWSETIAGEVEGPDESSPPAERLLAAAEAHRALCVYGCQWRAPHSGRLFNSALVVDPSSRRVDRYDKRALVPIVESPLTVCGLRLFSGEHPFSAGANAPTFAFDNGRRSSRFAVAICYDVSFPALMRDYFDDPAGGPDFLLIASSEPYDGATILQQQMRIMTRFRAIELRRAIVRNVSGGYSGIVAPSGVAIDAPADLVLNVPTSLGHVPIYRGTTLYRRYGDFLPVALMIGLSAGFARPLWAQSGRRGRCRPRPPTPPDVLIVSGGFRYCCSSRYLGTSSVRP